MATKKIDKELALGLKEYIELELQIESSQSTIEKNKKRQVELIKTHKRLGNVVGILRKPTKEAADAQAEAEEEKEGEASVPMEEEEHPEPPKKKKKSAPSTEENILRILAEKKSSRKGLKPGGIDPGKAVERGGGQFHSSSHSNPPPVVDNQ